MSGTEWLVIAGVFGLTFWGLLIWFSVRAKPLGGKPYRWATYIAITTGLGSISLALTTVSAISKDGGGKVMEEWAVVFTSACCALCCVGLFRRKRFGVVMFCVAYFLIWAMVPFFDAYYKTPSNRTPAQQTESGLFFVYFVVTAFYFKRRWRLMGKE
jgi:hypothetical protein